MSKASTSFKIEPVFVLHIGKISLHTNFKIRSFSSKFGILTSIFSLSCTKFYSVIHPIHIYSAYVIMPGSVLGAWYIWGKEIDLCIYGNYILLAINIVNLI